MEFRYRRIARMNGETDCKEPVFLCFSNERSRRVVDFNSVKFRQLNGQADCKNIVRRLNVCRLKIIIGHSV